jgi:hypothetical protein
VLLRLGRDAPAAAPIEQAARRRAVPLATVSLDEPEACAIYERKLVLVRPDGHVAWRGDTLPQADPLIAQAIGWI